MKRLIASCGLISALFASGCQSFDRSQLKTGGEHVVARQFGWELFNCLPLGAKVNLDNVHEDIHEYANGRRVEYCTVMVKDNPFITVFGIPIPWIITYHECQVSGVLK